jgi:hypothetical protein
MKKAILSVAAASALALGGMAATPQSAHAVAWWVAPAIVGGVIGGVALGATAANANAYAYQPAYAYEPAAYGPSARGVVYAAPTASCYWARVPTGDGRLIRQRICD